MSAHSKPRTERNQFGAEDEPVAAKAVKKMFSAFKTIMSFSGVTAADARELEAEEEVTAPVIQEEMYYDDVNCDPSTAGMTWEEVLSRSRNLFMEEEVRRNKQLHSSSSALGDVELSTRVSWGTSHKSVSEIEADFASPSCSYGGSSISRASCSYDIV